MDPEQYADAVERLEQDYLAGGMSADEYTRRRRELEERASTTHHDPEPAAYREPMPPLEPAPSLAHASGDPVRDARLASWGRRAGGWFVDVAVILSAWIVLLIVSLTTGDATALFISVLLFFGPAIYAWLMVGKWGQTLGKMAVGIRVVRSQDAGRVSYARALGRAASVWALGLLGLPLLLSYLWPLWDRRNQTLHDKMAGTIVVHGAAADASD